MFFVNLGNTAKEVIFSFETVRKGIKEFLLKYSAPTSLSPLAKDTSHFRTIISVDAGSEGEQITREFLSKNGWHGKFEVITNQNNQHIDAMAASDYGISYDG